MDRLPQELVDRISKYLPKGDLNSVLTLTSKFRYAAERYSGAFSEFTINERDSEKFLALYSGHRLPLLQEVIFSSTFYREDLGVSCRENTDILRKKDEMFTLDIKFLFNTLRSVEERAREKKAYGKYRLSIYCQTEVIGIGECLHQAYVSWRVHLLNAAELPQITSVHSFELNNNDEEIKGYHNQYNRGGDIKLDLRIIIDLVVKFPNLEYLAFRTGGYEWCPTWPEEEPAKHYEHDWEGPRRDARDDFANTVTSCGNQLPSPLKRASLDFLNPLDRSINIHQNKALPDFVGHLQKDPFSSSLRVLTNNLRQLQLRAMIDESFFWPDSDTAFFWPNLEILEIMFHPARPDGKWYFQGPGGEGRDAAGFTITNTSYPPYEKSGLDVEMDKLYEENSIDRRVNGSCQFRISPHEFNLRPLLEGFAKAATQIRSLKEALIWSPLSWYLRCLDSDDSDDEFEANLDSYTFDNNTNLAWGIAYFEPGLRTNAGSFRQLRWMVAHWRPGAELHALFQQIGRDKHGEELNEFWMKTPVNELVMDRDSFFEDFMFCDDPGHIPSPY